MKFGTAVGSVSSRCLNDVYLESPFNSPEIDLGKNFYGKIEAAASKPRGVTTEHLCKVWSIDKEEAD